MKPMSLFLYVESSLHAGVGSTVSAIDLPIQRERTTQYPLVQGSGVKGALRNQVIQPVPKAEVETVFGSEPPTQPEGEEPETGENRRKPLIAGAASFGDAHIVLFPVRSLVSVFAYTTSPEVLARLCRSIEDFPQYIYPPDNQTALVASDNLTTGNKIILEEFSYMAQVSPEAGIIAAWLANRAFPDLPSYDYWKEKVRRDLVILPNDEFRDFTLTATEVATRVRLNNGTKTVKEGGLWTEEALPSDTVLVSTVFTRQSRHPAVDWNEDVVASWLRNEQKIPRRIQLGGDETTGQGVVALQWL